MSNNKMEKEEILEAKIEKAEYKGWTVSERKKHTILLEKQSFGSLKAHVVVAILTVWWSFGIGNILYALYKYLKPEEMVLDKTELGTDSNAEDSNAEDSDTEEAEGAVVDAEIAVKSPEERKQELEERELRLQELQEKRRQQQEAARNTREAMKTVRKFF